MTRKAPPTHCQPPGLPKDVLALSPLPMERPSVPLCGQCYRGELGCLPTPGVSAQLGHLLSPWPPLGRADGLSRAVSFLIGRARAFLGQPLPVLVPGAPSF